MSLITRGAKYSRIGIGGALIALSVTMLAGTANAAATGAGTSRTTATHAAHLTATAGAARGRHLTHSGLAPNTPGGIAGSSTATSWNWDGYTTLNTSDTNTNSFNKVSATWVQPRITCDGTNNTEWDGFWVGLDGWLNDNVEQGGSEAACFNDVPTYNVWWEMFPFNDIVTSFTIHPGDTISASVVFNTSTSQFDITVKDVTLNQTLTEDIACQSGQANCERSSADVISEDIGGGTDQDGLYLLANYGTATYNNVSITNTAGHTGTISDTAWNNVAITEVSSAGVTKQTVGALSNGGKTFTTTWKAESGK